MISPPRDQIEISDMPHWQRSSLVTRFVHRLKHSLGTWILNSKFENITWKYVIFILAMKILWTYNERSKFPTDNQKHLVDYHEVFYFF